MEILKETSLGNLIIKAIPKALAKSLIIKNHYSHKWNDGGFGKFNYGIFRAEEHDKCLGVAVYGLMKTPNAKIFTHPNADAWMCELNRMWIDDALGHNAESILIAASIKLLRKTDPTCVAIQSFAEGRLGCGTIYKASNFKYFGFHYTTFCRSKRNGEVVHQQVLTNSTSPTGYLRTNTSFLLGEYDIFKVKTYRYIYPLCKKFKFNKPSQSYPAYEIGEEATVWKRDKSKIKENIIRLLDKIAA